MENQLLESFFVFGDLPATIEKGTFLPALIAVSYVVATLGSYTGLSVASLIRSSKTTFKKYVMLWLGAFAYGSGFWSMHFVGMLAYRTRLDVSYNPWITFLSLLLSVVVVYFVLRVTRATEKPSQLRIFLGSVLLGIGICAMHYTGMEAMRMNAELRFVPSLFFLSIALAVLASEAALWIVFTLSRSGGRNPLIWRIIAAMVMGAGICGAYYVGMAAAVITPFPDNAASAASQSPQLLALIVLAVTTLLLFILTFAISNRICLTVGFGALFTLPLVIIIYQAVSALNLEIHNIGKEQFGIVYHKELAQLLHRLEDKRDLTYVLHSGETEFSDRLAPNTEEMKASLAKIDGFNLAPLENEAIVKSWLRLKADILNLQDPREAEQPADEFKRYSGVVRALLNFMDDVADDANISAYFGTGKDSLLNYSIHVVPDIWESVSLLRSQATGMLALDKKPEQWTDDERFKLKNGLNFLNAEDIGLEDTLKRTEVLDNNPLRLGAYNDRVIEPLVQKFTEDIESIAAARALPMSSVEMFALATETLKAYDPFYDTPAEAFRALLKQREAERRFTRDLMIYSSMAAFVGFIALFVFLNRSLLKTERAQAVALQTQKEIAVRLIEKERLERQMQDYTDSLELSRFDVIDANTRIKEEEAKIRAIMDNVSEGIVVLNDFSIIQNFNKVAERLFGYTSQEAIGRTASLLIPPEEGTEQGSLIKRYIENKEDGILGVAREVVGQRKDRSRFPMIINMSEVVLGKTRLFIALVRDITAQKEKEEDLLRTKERAEAANKTKSDFLANMSHELRTPLNSVFGMTRLLLSTKLTAEQQELANTVLISSNNLTEIVNDILDLSKIEAGEVHLERIGFDPRQILYNTVRALAHFAREKHIPIVRFYEKETLPYVVGDPLRMGRIMTNLLSNAIKYTEAGHIEVRANARYLDETFIELRCEVTDTGIGIPANKLDSVFDKFVQADSSTTRKYGGTGLGLAITRELVSMMGGKIGVDSRVGQGSTFWFTIPFEITDKLYEEQFTRQQKTLKGAVPPKDARVLVAEDHPMNQMLIKRLLDKFGIGAVKVVANGNEALSAYAGASWTAILMDCHMPEKNGYDATMAIREMEKSGQTRVPIVAMTANAMVGDKEKCLQSGMDEYVSKPINIEELKEVLSQWMAFDASALNDGEFMPEKTPAVDLTMLRTLTGGDAEIEKELMQTFVVQSDENVGTMRKYSSADGENKPFSEAAHMLKGGSGSIGAEDLRQLCSEAQLYKGNSSGRLALLEKIDEEYARVKEHLKHEGLLA